MDEGPHLAVVARDRSRRAATGCVAILALALVVHVASAYLGVGLRRGSAAEDWLQIVIILAAGLICAWRGISRREERWAWVLIGAGFASFASGNVAYAVMMRHTATMPVPSWPDLGWLGFYALQWVGLILLLRAQVARFYASVWLDGLVAAAGVAAVATAVLVEPVLRATSGSLPVVATTLAYPLGDVVLASVVVFAIALSGARPARVWRLVGAGLALFVVADSLYLWQIAKNTYVDGGPLDSLWALASVLVAFAAWHPGRRREMRLEGWTVLVLPCVFFLASIGVLVYGALEPLDGLAVGLAAASLLCAGARTALTFREARLLQQSRVEALTDDLTGLPNRRHLRRHFAAAAADGRTQALVLLDLDSFKELNDTLGHDAGDRLLNAVGRRLSRSLPSGGLLARLGGDEFAALVPVGEDREGDALAASEALRACLDGPIRLADVSLVVAAAFGVAIAPRHGGSFAELLRHADVAMYQAKRRGGPSVLYDPARDSHSRERISLAADLKEGIERGELELHFQPKADLRTGAIVGAEALVRWRHPERGLLYPDAFVSVAEQTGLMRPLTDAVLEAAVAAASRWAAAGHSIPVAVNLSPRDLVDLNLPVVVEALLARAGATGKLLQIELTEQTLMHEPERVAAVLDRLAAIGVQRALDDFGTGYSSLAYLQRLRVDELKVDRSFVSAMGDDPASETIVRSILDLARGLGLRTVAEGVETSEVQARLTALGCDQFQGFLLARPMDEAALRSFLDDPSRRRAPASGGPRAHAG